MKKKLLSLGMAVLLLMSLMGSAGLLAASTGVSNVVVELQQDTVKLNSQYKITFNSNEILTGGLDTLHVVFPAEYKFDTSWQAGHADINGYTSGGVDYTNRTLSILVPKGLTIYGGQPVTLTLSSGIMRNPEVTGQYTFKVYTSKETTQVTSKAFSITEYVQSNSVSRPRVTLEKVQDQRAQSIEISFNTNQGGGLVGGDDQIILTFPEVFDLPKTLAKDKVLINGQAMQSSAPIIVNQQVFLPLNVGLNIGEGKSVSILFKADSGITIDRDRSDVTLEVVTTEDTQPIASYPFDVVKTADMPYVPTDSKNPEVKVAPNGAGGVGSYTFTIWANTMDTFEGGNIMGFTLTFPSGTVLPGTIQPQQIMVNGQQSNGVLVNPTRREIIFTLPVGVSRSRDIEIQVSSAAGIKNPQAGQYIMDIMANKGLRSMTTRSFEIKTVADTVETPVQPPQEATERVVKLTINSKQATKNGESILLDVPAALIDSFTMVPVRFVSDGLGAAIDYNAEQNTVTMVYRDRSIVLWPGSSIAKVDNTPVTLAKAPMIRDGRTLVPIRFVSECFGAVVEFVSTSQPITITVKSDSTLPSVATIQASQIMPGSTAPPSTSPTQPTAPTSGVVGKEVILDPENSRANLRSGPGTSYSILGILLPGEEAEIKEVSKDSENMDWYKVYFDYGMTAWIRSDLVAFTS